MNELQKKKNAKNRKKKDPTPVKIKFYAVRGRGWRSLYPLPTGTAVNKKKINKK